ncbi:MAG: RHS repeat-associated core domain-containing protein [Ignavibacteriales bacterium]|nr:hypothetical protein [Ignavibacteriaceae bacterium]QOJ29216.1 MAG: RHS repeat-associated core domain-containing protein [Ignavibacteriales bacterium]
MKNELPLAYLLVYPLSIGNKLSNDDNMGYYEANYSTDSRGNITADEYRSTSNITYDNRNLPLQFSANGTTVKYSYDDNGNRIYKEFGTTKEFYLRDHTGQELAIFKVSGSSDTLMFYNIYGLGLEGRAEQTWSWNYETEPPQIERSEEPIFYIKDHLGTIRVTINKQGTILFAADYWPYGEKMAEYNSGTGTVQRYIFTEKERDTETGYDYFGARFYDSDLGRWMTVDPLMDKYPGWSPYNYVMGNPLRLVDPDGMKVNDGDEDKKDKEKKNINLLQALSDAWYELQITFTGSVVNPSGGSEISNQAEIRKIVSSGTKAKAVKKKVEESAYKGLEEVENYSAETSRIAGGIALFTVWAPPVSGTFFTISNISGNISMTAGVLKAGISQSSSDGINASVDAGVYFFGAFIDRKIGASKILSDQEIKLTKNVFGSSYNVITNSLGF